MTKHVPVIQMRVASSRPVERAHPATSGHAQSKPMLKCATGSGKLE
jgi:hypothetical protein